jgi:hypothetical protein
MIARPKRTELGRFETSGTSTTGAAKRFESPPTPQKPSLAPSQAATFSPTLNGTLPVPARPQKKTKDGAESSLRQLRTFKTRVRLFGSEIAVYLRSGFCR